MNRPVAILIPTINNYQYLRPCLESILYAKTSENLFKVYVINNGNEHSCDFIVPSNDIEVIQAGDNLGWQGGLRLGLEKTKEPFVVFMNDDTHVPFAERNWLSKLLQDFKDPEVALSAPSSDFVMGQQNIFTPCIYDRFKRKFLIFFCVMARRSAVEEVGGPDDTLPGGDDFDLSIRLRDAGYKLVCNRNVFIYHHGGKTGNRLKGDSKAPGGWNSYDFKEKTDFALIKKHGLKKWWEVIKNAVEKPTVEYNENDYDKEGDLIRSMVSDKDRTILDLGCGGNKTIERAIGVDLVKDAVVDTIGTQSQADVVGDVSKPLDFTDVDVIIARHILEHMPDTLEVLDNWRVALKRGGKLIISVPDGSKSNYIPMNIEHLHNFTRDGLYRLVELSGFSVKKVMDSKNGVSFILYAEKL